MGKVKMRVGVVRANPSWQRPRPACARSSLRLQITLGPQLERPAPIALWASVPCRKSVDYD